MKRILLPILTAGVVLFASAGCTSRNLSMPTKAGPFVYESQRLGNKETLKEATFVGADGSSFSIRGFTSDQVEALGVVAEAAVRGAVQAFTGGAASGGLPTIAAQGLRGAPAARQTSENPLGAPVIVTGPDGAAYKLLVRNGVVLLAPTDEKPNTGGRP